MRTHFRDRVEAGQLLAERLVKYANRDDVLVLGLPRGGLPVAFEVARALNAPLDAFVVRKLGVPGQEELAMGAIATGGVRVLNEDVVRSLQTPEEIIDEMAGREQKEQVDTQIIHHPQLQSEAKVLCIWSDHSLRFKVCVITKPIFIGATEFTNIIHESQIVLKTKSETTITNKVKMLGANE